MQRFCDVLLAPLITGSPKRAQRIALRMGAYQLRFTDASPHAVVDETVGVLPEPERGLVNAVLRRLVDRDRTEVPKKLSFGERLSYPDWIVDRLIGDLGKADAVAAMKAMNEPPKVTTRDDGYVQDLASQWVTDLIRVDKDDTVIDLCAAPGGKATGLASRGATVIAVDLHLHRARLIRHNAALTGTANDIGVVVADGTVPPLRSGCADVVLLDAPCSGLGVLRRRPDARWKVTPASVDELVLLQRRLFRVAVELVCPGGMLVYSVCTLTSAETKNIRDWAIQQFPLLTLMALEGERWRSLNGGGLRLLPQDHGTDGMFVVAFRREGHRGM